MTRPAVAACPICALVFPTYGSRPIIPPHLRPASQRRDDPTGPPICPGSDTKVATP